MKKICISTITVACLLSVSQALTLKKTVLSAIENNKEIMSNNLIIDASKKDIEIEEGAYLPQVNFTTTLEKSKTQNNLDNRPKSAWTEKEGYISTISAEQLLYDGGRTPSLVGQREQNAEFTKYNSNIKNEKIVLDITKAYTKIVENELLTQVYNFNLQSHNDAYQIAADQEQLGGSKLESKKTQSLIAELKDEKTLKDLETNKSILELERLSVVENISSTCRTDINEKVIPETVEEAIAFAQNNNQSVLEQLAKIKLEEEQLGVEEAAYLPTIKARIEGTYDSDIELNNNGDQKDMKGQISLNWNFYSGGSDEAAQDKSKILISNEKKQLEVIQGTVKESITELYQRYFETKKRVENMKKTLTMQKEILAVVRTLLEDGTKTYSDELDSKSKVLETMSNLIVLESDLENIYYDLLFQMGVLSETILSTEQKTCKLDTLVNPLLNGESKETVDLDSLLNGTDGVEAPTIIAEPVKEIKLVATNNEDTLSQKLQKIYTNDYQYDSDSMSATIQISSHSFTLSKVNKADNFHSILESFVPDFLQLLKDEESSIDKVIIGSHTSSEFRRYTDQTKIDIANKGLSQRRANKVKNYFMDKSKNMFGNTKLIKEKVEVIGHGSDFTVKDANNVEDHVASRRITIQVVPK